jgi:hypothetical protein
LKALTTNHKSQQQEEREIERERRLVIVYALHPITLEFNTYLQHRVRNNKNRNKSRTE